MFIDLLSAFKRSGSVKWAVVICLLFCCSLGSAFSQNCDAEGGDLVFADDGSDTKILCTTDGVPDPLTVTVTGASGDNQIFLITDNYGNILANQTSPNFDFEGFDEGVCFIFNLAYSDDFTGDFDPGGNYCMFPNECFDLSDYLVVVKDCDFEFCEEEGGDLTIAGTDETAIVICAEDGESDAFDVDLQNNVSTNSAYLITDLEGNILAYPAMPPFDLENTGVGICLVWHISFEDDVTGLEEGANAEDIEGCFSLSNFIQVTRYVAEAGMINLAGGHADTTICVDNMEDPLAVIRTEDTAGEFFTFVITDAEGNILDIPEGEGPFDLNGAGPGTCLIWYLAYNPDIQGLEVGQNALDLSGCFDLSNSITVERNQPEGGEIQFESGSTDTTICAGDGVPDPLDVVQVSETSGSNFTFVITDGEGNILDIPSGNGPFDLDGAGGGTCLIWYLAFEDGLQGAEVGQNAGDLEGCFDLSNPLTVERNFTDGGTIAFADSTGAEIGDTITICAGDSIPDPLDVIQTGDPQGSNFTFVITDGDANILDIPEGNGPFNLDGAGGGTCLIWYLAFEDGLQGAEVGQNAANLEGCFDLSNPLTVVRLTGDECNECPFGEVPEISVDVEPATDPCETLRELTVNVSGPIEADSFMLVLTDSSGIIVNVANNTLGPVDFSVGRRRTGFGDPEELPLDFFNANLEFFGYTSPPHNVYLVGYGEDDYPFGINGLLPRVGDEVFFTNIQDLDTGCISISEPIPFDVENCVPPCDADAGTLVVSPMSDSCIFSEEGAFIAAEVNVMPTVPEGYAVVYVLTTGDSLLIIGSSFDPNFVVQEPGLYTIHTLVIDSFDLNLLDFLPPGATGGFVFGETIEGGGELCASLLVAGAQFDLTTCDGFCDLPDAPQILFEDESDTLCIDSIGQLSDLSVLAIGDLPDDNYGLFLVEGGPDGVVLNLAENTLGPVDFSVQGVAFDSSFTFPISPNLGFERTFTIALVIYDEDSNPYDLLDRGCDEPCRLPIDSLGDCFVTSNFLTVIENKCEADAGTLSVVGSPDVCLAGDGAELIAETDVAPTLPDENYTVVYLLTFGDSLVLLDSNDEPEFFAFTEDGPGLYTIHTLVIDTSDIEGLFGFLNSFPTPTGFDALEYIEFTGICADLLVAGAQFNALDDCDGELVINEVSRDGIIEFYNASPGMLDINNFRLSDGVENVALGDLNLVCGNMLIESGGFVSVQTNWVVGEAGERVLYTTDDDVEFIDYVTWGDGSMIYTQMAIDAGLWSEGLEVQAPTEDRSLQYFPGSDKEWDLNAPTICAPNESPLSAGQLNGPGELLVFPNPASDQLTVETSAFIGQTGTLQLSDINGRTVLMRDMDQLNGRLELNLPALARGTYMLRLTSEQAIRVIKLQIQ
ncbi:MAG: T9SS type A sorting domain-containing protein [Bacteroidota bacterium]